MDKYYLFGVWEPLLELFYSCTAGQGTNPSTEGCRWSESSSGSTAADGAVWMQLDLTASPLSKLPPLFTDELLSSKPV